MSSHVSLVTLEAMQFKFTCSSLKSGFWNVGEYLETSTYIHLSIETEIDVLLSEV